MIKVNSGMHSQVYENKIKQIVYISLNGICKAVRTSLQYETYFSNVSSSMDLLFLAREYKVQEYIPLISNEGT